MKKVLVCLALLASFSSILAQSPRFGLVEVFTSASSVSSGKQSRRLDSLVDSVATNSVRCAYLTYHTSPPQPQDTLAKQTQAAVTVRKSFYDSNNGIQAPSAWVCGEKPTKGSNPNNPASISQAKLDSFLNLTSNYVMTLQFRLSSDKDSIFVECSALCTQNFTGSLTLRMMLMEQDIVFNAPIGSDVNQKKFYNVYRATLSEPALDNQMKFLGNSKTYYYAGPLPSFIYNKSKLSVVAFIQENTTKKINQAVISNAPAKLDVKLTTTFANSLICNPTNLSIPFTLKNNGELPIASLLLSYQVDNQTPQSITTGIGPTTLLMSGMTKSFTTTPVTLTPGQHTIRIVAAKPNLTTDDTLSNDTIKTTFLVLSPHAVLPLKENFAGSATIPAGFFVKDLDMDGVTWRYDSKGIYAGGSALAPCFEMPVGSKDELFFPQVQLPSGSPYYLTFDRAHAQYAFPTGITSNDKLDLLISSDCGLNWSTVWSKSGATLATTPPITVELIPTQQQQWLYEAISLSAFAGQNLLMKLVATSDYGNHIYLDNIRIINTPTAVEIPRALQELSVYPVPASKYLSFSLEAETAGEVRWALTDLNGKTVQTGAAWVAAGAQTLVADVAALSNGLYLLEVTTAQGTTSQKVMVNR